MNMETESSAWTRGQVGTLLLILAETSFFAVFLVAYLFYIGKSFSGPQPADVLTLPVLATVALLSSSVTVWVAVKDLERGHTARFASTLLATILLGGFFLVMTAREWNELIFEHGLTITTNLFGHHLLLARRVPRGPRHDRPAPDDGDSRAERDRARQAPRTRVAWISSPGIGTSSTRSGSRSYSSSTWWGLAMKEGIEIPAPTPYPLYFALGIALLFAGLVTTC